MKVLFVDDNRLDLPSEVVKQYYSQQFGIEVINADPDNPIESAREILRDHLVTALLSDNCRRPNYSHLTEFRKEHPHLLIALRTGALTNADRKRALEAGADVCIEKGEQSNLEQFLERASDPYLGAQRRFLADLPTLLERPELYGKWVAYTSEGQQGDPADDDLTLIEQFISKSNARKFFFGRVLPEMNESEVSRPGQVEDAV